jgi:uncharacterized hydrophobic protein (TIGR00271 family)
VLGVVTADRVNLGRCLLLLAAGAAAVVALSWPLGHLVPYPVTAATNSQVAARVTPRLVDLVAALATGAVGSVALTRPDISDTLPGVAIAISLVPPLAVVGVCLGRGSLSLAVGALLLFLSNLVALVLTGVLVFAVLGYGTVLNPRTAASPRRAYIGLTVLLVAVVVPLVANTLAALAFATWLNRATQDAQSWLEAVPTATVTGVDFNGYAMVINVQTPGGLPDLAPLLARLDRDLPAGITVTVQTTLGQRIDVGTTD